MVIDLKLKYTTFACMKRPQISWTSQAAEPSAQMTQIIQLGFGRKRRITQIANNRDYSLNYR